MNARTRAWMLWARWCFFFGTVVQEVPTRIARVAEIVSFRRLFRSEVRARRPRLPGWYVSNRNAGLYDYPKKAMRRFQSRRFADPKAWGMGALSGSDRMANPSPASGPGLPIPAGAQVATFLNTNPSGIFYLPYVAPASFPTLDPELLTAGATFSPTFIGGAKRGGLPAPVSGITTLPAKGYGIIITNPDSSANRVTWTDPVFRCCYATSPLLTNSAYVGPNGFIWGTNSTGIVGEQFAAIDMGFPLTRNTGPGIYLASYDHLTSVGTSLSQTLPTSGTSFVATVSGNASYTILANAGAGSATAIITGPRGTHTISNTLSSGNTHDDNITVQQGATYTLSGTSNPTFTTPSANVTGTTVSASSPPFITPNSLKQDGGIIEYQGFTSLVFSAQGCYIGSDGQGADLASATLGRVDVYNVKVFSQDQYSTDAAFDMECGGASVGWDYLGFNVELHNAKWSCTGCNTYKIVNCWHEFSLTGKGPIPLFRTYQSTSTQGFGSLWILDTTAIQRGLTSSDSSQMVLVTGSTNAGTTPFHADEIRIQGSTFLSNGAATGGNLVTPINLDPANAATQPFDRVILKDNRYSYTVSTPASTKPFYTVGYGGGTGGTYTSTTLIVDGLTAIGAAAASERFPQTFGGACTSYAVSINPDANTVTLTTFRYTNIDLTAITAPTAYYLTGANTTITNIIGGPGNYPNVDSGNDGTITVSASVFTYIHGVSITNGTLPGGTFQGPARITVRGGTITLYKFNGTNMVTAAGSYADVSLSIGDRIDITFSGPPTVIIVHALG